MQGQFVWCQGRMGRSSGKCVVLGLYVAYIYASDLGLLLVIECLQSRNCYRAVGAQYGEFHFAECLAC
jgi:hypothetical protein